jgi:hypothetical protein
VKWGSFDEWRVKWVLSKKKQLSSLCQDFSFKIHKQYFKLLCQFLSSAQPARKKAKIAKQRFKQKQSAHSPRSALFLAKFK